MSVVTYAELRAGLEMQASNRAQDERVLKLLTQRILVLPLPTATARCAPPYASATAAPWTD